MPGGKNDTSAPLHILLDDDLEEKLPRKVYGRRRLRGGGLMVPQGACLACKWGGQGSVPDADGEVITRFGKPGHGKPLDQQGATLWLHSAMTRSGHRTETSLLAWWIFIEPEAGSRTSVDSHSR